MAPFSTLGTATRWSVVLAALSIAAATFTVATPAEPTPTGASTEPAAARADQLAPDETPQDVVTDVQDSRSHAPDEHAADEATDHRPSAVGAGEARDDVLASFDFDDGMQGWTVETTAECSTEYLYPGVIEDGAETLQPTPSTWEHRRDVDNYDRGLKARGGDPGDHHVAVVEYRNCTDTRLVSPEFAGDGSPVTLTFDQRHWTEADFDRMYIEQRIDDVWQELDSCHGRGRYPLWDPVSVTFTPEGPFQVSFRFTSDRAVDGRGRFNRRMRAVKGDRGGLGVWIDDVRVVADASTPLPCVPERPDEEATASGSSADRPSSDRPVAAQRQDTASSQTFPPSTTSLPDPVGVQTHELLADRSTHPEYQAMVNREDEMPLDRWLTDPYRWDWDGTRGRMREVWILNRYEAPLSATMYAPLEDGTYPAIVFVGGGGLSDSPAYSSILQRLAEEGYVVLSVAPQGFPGQGERGSAIKPAREFCGSLEATADQWWRQPQEAGLVETNYCAGDVGIDSLEDQPPYECAGDVQYPECHRVESRTGNGQSYGDHNAYEVYPLFAASWTFAALDAVEWLTAPDNPWRHLVDRDRIGTAGHSLGGYAAMVAANAHPDVSAAVGFDQGGRWPEGLERLDTPTLLIGAENGFYWLEADGTFATPDPGENTHFRNQKLVAQAAREAGVDSGWLVLDDALHNDFFYLPYPSAYAAAQASRWGQAVGLHYTLAWFDRHLKGLPDARDRLLGDTFDSTADRTAIGVGRWNPIDGNVPYQIEGRTVADHLSERFPNWIHLDGQTTDLR